MAFLSGLATTFTGLVSNYVRYDEYIKVQKERSFFLCSLFSFCVLQILCALQSKLMQQTSPVTKIISPLNTNNPYDGITKSHSSHMVKGRTKAIGGMDRGQPRTTTREAGRVA